MPAERCENCGITFIGPHRAYCDDCKVNPEEEKIRERPKTYAVELEKGVYLAPVNGDPGRTLKLTHASAFLRQQYAQTALARARQYRPFPNAKIRTMK